MITRFEWPDVALCTSAKRGELAVTLAGMPVIETDDDGSYVSWIRRDQRASSHRVERVAYDDAERFCFVDNQGERFEFQPLTLVLYNTVLREHDPKLPEFAMEADMLEAMASEW